MIIYLFNDHLASPLTRLTLTSVEKHISEDCLTINDIVNQNPSLRWSFMTGKLNETSRRQHTLRSMCSDALAQSYVCCVGR